MSDELDDLLKPYPVPAAPPERKEQLLTTTLGQLKHTRRIRQAQQGGMWLVVFLVGVSLGWLGWQRTSEQAAIPTAAKASVPVSPPLLTAAQLELQAEKSDDPAQSALLYRQAGDRFLDANDLRSALRCYRLHLNEGGPNARLVASSDSWLLINLKTETLGRER